MADKAKPVMTEESRKALPSIVTGPESILTKEVTMSNSKSTTKNIPAFVAETANQGKSELVQVRDLLVRGIRLEVEDYTDGYIGVTNPEFDGMVAGVDRFGYTNHAKGFFTAVAQVKDSKSGEFGHGFHFPEGRQAIMLTRDEKKDYRGRSIPRGYVRWDILLNPLFAEVNAERIAWLKQFGIEPNGENPGRWLAVGAQNNRPFILWPVTPIDYAEFEAFMAKEHGTVDYGTPEWKQYEDDRFDLPWNTVNKHDGLEALLHVLEGTTRVGIKFRPFRTDSNPELTLRKWDEMLTKHYNSLWSLTADERRARKDAEAEQGEAARRLRGRVIASVTNPAYEPTAPAVAASEKGKATVFAAPGEAKAMAVAEIVGKKVKIVAADGSQIKPAMFLPTEAYVLGALDMATDLHGILQVL